MVVDFAGFIVIFLVGMVYFVLVTVFSLPHNSRKTPTSSFLFYNKTKTGARSIIHCILK